MAPHPVGENYGFIIIVADWFRWSGPLAENALKVQFYTGTAEHTSEV